MVSDTFLYVSIIFLPCLSLAQQFFTNQGLQQHAVWSRGYQPPPTSALLPEYARQTAPPAFNPFQSRFVPHKPQAFPRNPYLLPHPPATNPEQGFFLPERQNVTSTPMRVVPNPKSPIVINTLIQVFIDGKNSRNVGDHGLEGRIVTGIYNNHRVNLAREFDTKTLTFVENDKDSFHGREDIVNIKAVATSNATEIDRDELAEELEHELANSIPLILEEFDKVKTDKKQKKPFKDTMMIENLNNASKHETHLSPPNVDAEDDVNIEDLEQLIRDGLDKLENGEAKKKLEEEFHAVLLSSTKLTSPASSGSSSTLAISNALQDMEKQAIRSNERTPEGASLTTTLPPGIVTTFENLEPITDHNSNIISSTSSISTTSGKTQVITADSVEFMGATINPITTVTDRIKKITTLKTGEPMPKPTEMTMPEQGFITSTEDNVSLINAKVVTEPTEMVVLIKETEIKSEESETEDNTEVTRSTAIPAKTITPEKVKIIETVETTPIFVKPTSKPTEMVVPTKTTVSTTVITTTKKPTTTSTFTTTRATKPATLTAMIATTTKQITTTPASTSNYTPAMTTKPPAISTVPLPMTMTPVITDLCKIPNDESDTLRGDVMFLLDSSTSVRPKDFKKAVQLIKQVVLNFKNIGPNGVQFGLVQYNREPWLEFTFRRHNCISQLLSDIDDTEFMNGPSNLSRAMDKVLKYGFTPTRGDRPDAENVLVLVTDDLSDDQALHPITLGQINGTTSITVATLHGKKEILMSLAGNDQKNLFNLTEAFTNSLGNRLADRIKYILEMGQRSNTTNQQILTAPLKYLVEKVLPNNIDHKLPTNSFSSIAPMMLPIENDSSASVTCTHNGIIAIIKIPENFCGAIVARDFSHDPKCTIDIPLIDKDSSNVRPVEVELKVGQCGVRILKMDDTAARHSVVLNVLHNRDLTTAQDKSYIIQCFHSSNPSTTELEAKLTTDVVLPFSKTISLSVTPPKCRYSLRRDTVNGPLVTSAKIGQVVYHRWECDGDERTNKAYGLYIHDCKATNTSARHNNFAIIDDNGCSTDPSVVNEIIYVENQLRAFAKSYVFTLVDVTTLLFSCKVSLCVRDGDGCEGYLPPVCATSNMTDLLLTRRVRHYDEGLEAALTSQVRTDVIDVSNPLVSTRLYHIHFPVIAVITLALILGSLLGVLSYCIDSRNEKKAASVHSASSQYTFPDDESTTDKSETLSFKSLGFRISNETNLDMSEAVPSASLSFSELQA